VPETPVWRAKTKRREFSHRRARTEYRFEPLNSEGCAERPAGQPSVSEAELKLPEVLFGVGVVYQPVDEVLGQRVP